MTYSDHGNDNNYNENGNDNHNGFNTKMVIILTTDLYR